LSTHQRADENTEKGTHGGAGPFGWTGVEGVGNKTAQKRFQTVNFQAEKRSLSQD
jgi:hypothetical protein